jgi:hypothetical protein
LIRHDWIAVQKNNRRFFDFLRYAPVAQNDSYLDDSYLVCNRLEHFSSWHRAEAKAPLILPPRPRYTNCEFALMPDQ